MNKYETVILLDENITEEQRLAVISKIENYIKENGEITNEENIGRRKLAYQVRMQDYAYYYIIEFSTEPQNISELERIYRITDEILKFIVVRKED